ncbi:AAA family ATPase [Nocardia sp. NPDC052566]|uniref:AAA family ATPase n=1 Tax=Nocardia sp. NPDC052566 TaxID=3364330 RepID=UPI0037C70715
MSAFVRRVVLDRRTVPSFDEYPFSLPGVRELTELELHPRVTFIVGENGSGKSTLLEAIATEWGFNPEGGTKNFNFATRSSHSSLNEHLRLVKSMDKPRDGFFLRAESFFNVATNIENLDREFSFGPPVIDSYGGVSLHEQSHGESFFALMLHRFGGNGFYVLDEPEAALSPNRQLAMIARLHELVRARSQFVIATHSPLLMSYPDAWIYQIGDDGYELVDYEETAHYRLTRTFLENPDTYLDMLLD